MVKVHRYISFWRGGGGGGGGSVVKSADFKHWISHHCGLGLLGGGWGGGIPFFSGFSGFRQHLINDQLNISEIQSNLLMWSPLLRDHLS